MLLRVPLRERLRECLDPFLSCTVTIACLSIISVAYIPFVLWAVEASSCKPDSEDGFFNLDCEAIMDLQYTC